MKFIKKCPTNNRANVLRKNWAKWAIECFTVEIKGDLGIFNKDGVRYEDIVEAPLPKPESKSEPESSSGELKYEESSESSEISEPDQEINIS